jgi:hypothetical protein
VERVARRIHQVGLEDLLILRPVDDLRYIVVCYEAAGSPAGEDDGANLRVLLPFGDQLAKLFGASC